MKTMHLISAISLLGPAAAFAQPQGEAPEASNASDHPAAPETALEITVGAGYSQSWGPVGGGLRHLEDISRVGGAVELDLGYRINPTFSIGAYGTFSDNATGDRVSGNADALGATAGIQAAAHLRSDRSIDPWLSLGTGLKGLWLSPGQGKNTSLRGLDLARLQLGIDYRVNEDVSISPLIGGSLDMFVSQDSPMTNGYTKISDKKINFTGFAGFAGRFDIGGKR